MTLAHKPVVVVGSINIDLVANTERIPIAGETILSFGFQTHPGGKGANQAVAVARLGHPVHMIGRVGDDAFGRQLRDHMSQQGVDLAGVAVTQASSGIASIIVARNGENCIVITPGANALLTPVDLDTNIEIIRSAAIVLTQLEIPLETVECLSHICRREGVPLILDPAPAAALPPRLLSAVTWFTPNESEAAFFTGGSTQPHLLDPATMANTFIAKGIPGVVLKLGARGAYIASRNSPAEHVPAFPVKALDTTAAGDAFNGAFAVALLQGKSPAASAGFANAAAALSVTQSGAQSSMPTLQEVLQLIAS